MLCIRNQGHRQLFMLTLRKAASWRVVLLLKRNQHLQVPNSSLMSHGMFIAFSITHSWESNSLDKLIPVIQKRLFCWSLYGASDLSNLSHSSTTLQLELTSGCFACGTTSGFVIYNVEPFRETFRRTFTSGGTVEHSKHQMSLWIASDLVTDRHFLVSLLSLSLYVWSSTIHVHCRYHRNALS